MIDCGGLGRVCSHIILTVREPSSLHHRNRRPSEGELFSTSVSLFLFCTGKTQRDGVGGRREGGSGWEIHVNPWLIHVNVWQKPLQYCKVISLQLIKINGKKKAG